jgi:hypothetical protein
MIVRRTVLGCDGLRGGREDGALGLSEAFVVVASCWSQGRNRNDMSC